MPVTIPREGPRSLYVAARLVTIGIVVTALWIGQVILIPIALAAIVTFLMCLLVTRLDRVRVPRVLGVVIVAGTVTALLIGMGYLLVGQLSELADELPQHQTNIREKLADLREF